MGPLVAVLLLPSAAALQYRWQADVAPGTSVQTIQGVSRPVCAILCERLPLQACSGIMYEAGGRLCHLVSGDCRGPAALSSPRAGERYLVKSDNQCPGEH